MMKRDALDVLITELTKPIYVYRMSAGVDYYQEDSPLLKSAQTRRNNARAEIKKIVYDYVRADGGFSPRDGGDL